ncbi:MAG: OmpA family protein [Gammaproteobacteria bacterium]|nr:OmpA family protein [Gammaproteobacteria bacterium]
MRKKIIAMAVLASFMASGAQAAEHKLGRDEKIGFGVGLVAGSLAGPAGAMFGGMLGATLVDIYSRARLSDELTGQVQALESETQEYRVETLQLRQSLADARTAVAAARVQLASQVPGEQVADSLSFDLLFRTGVSELGEEELPRLQQLGRLLDAHPELQLRLDGFADQRGEFDFNQQLSEARVAAVRQALEQAGLDPQRIQIAAWGESESRAIEGDLDGYAMERKVRVRLVAPSSAMSARSVNQ